MAEVVITGMGFYSALGNLEQTWQAMVDGKSAIRAHQPFSDLPSYPLAMIGNQPSHLDHLAPRLIAQCLHSAHLTPPLPNLAIAIGSSRGFQSHWEAKIEGQSLVPWLESLPQRLASLAAQKTGATGIVTAISAACTTGLQTLAYGYDLIQSGQAEQVLVGAVECPITPLNLATFDKIGALASTGCYPFDRDREGLVLGEGGAFFLLESRSSAQARQCNIYSHLLGYGLTCDAHHATAPDPKGKMAMASINQCLTKAQLTPDQIGLIHTHGTGTNLNDRLESYLINHLFPHQPKVIATKGYTGHALGASGALSTALTIKILQEQSLITNAGLSNSDFNLNFPLNAGPGAISYSLVLGFGFGGQNAAIALGRASPSV